MFQNIIDFDIDMTMINTRTKELTFNMSVSSASEEVNNEDNVLLLRLPVQLAADVTITG